MIISLTSDDSRMEKDNQKTKIEQEEEASEKKPLITTVKFSELAEDKWLPLKKK